MFETWQQKVVLVIFVLLLLTIPVGSYLVTQRTNTKASASQIPVPTSITESTISAQLSPLDEIRKLTEDLKVPALSTESAVSADSFGPVLSFKLSLEGRPTDKQASKVFVGISEFSLNSSTPKYLLSFTINLPDSGLFSKLSLAGLTPGNKYSVYIKPSAQIATASAFIMNPTSSFLNDNKALYLITGDLNEDNVINSADYSIAKGAFGTKASSANWNEIIDFNKDGVINALDLAFITKNMAKTGESGVWTSPVPNVASKSGSPNFTSELSSPLGHPSGASGHWLWIPK